MKNIVVISPHPDDETLGCGGSIIKHMKQGDKIYWIIITKPYKNANFDKNFILKRKKEIKQVNDAYKFKKCFELNIETTKVKEEDKGKLINKINKIFMEVKPNTIFAPFENDVHTDHQIISLAIQSSIKWFRHKYIEEVFLYETLSETNFNRMNSESFKPNTYYDITKFLNSKIKIMKIYKSEILPHPFPRSEISIKSLAYLRGSECGFKAAEAFKLIYTKI